MLGVCFRSEHRGWMQDQWSWVFSNFGITNIYGRGFGEGTDEDIYQSMIEVDTAADLPSEPELVVIQPPDAQFIAGENPLQDFVHPDNAIYVFGGSQANMSDEDDLGGRTPDHLIYIPTQQYEMYGHATAYITLWDRYVKRGDFG